MSEQSRVDVLFWHKRYRNDILNGVIPNLRKAEKMAELVSLYQRKN